MNNQLNTIDYFREYLQNGKSDVLIDLLDEVAREIHPHEYSAMNNNHFHSTSVLNSNLQFSNNKEKKNKFEHFNSENYNEMKVFFLFCRKEKFDTKEKKDDTGKRSIPTNTFEKKIVKILKQRNRKNPKQKVKRSKKQQQPLIQKVMFIHHHHHLRSTLQSKQLHFPLFRSLFHIHLYKISFLPIHLVCIVLNHQTASVHPDRISFDLLFFQLIVAHLPQVQQQLQTDSQNPSLNKTTYPHNISVQQPIAIIITNG